MKKLENLIHTNVKHLPKLNTITLRCICLFTSWSLSYAFAIYINGFSNYCDCFSANIFCYLLIILIADHFEIQGNNLLSLVISVYKSFKTKLRRISYSLQYCFILNYLIELSLNLILQHADIEPSPGRRG